MFRGLFRKVADLFTQRRELDEALFAELEETLLEADAGPGVAARLVQELRQAVRQQRLQTPEQARGWLEQEIARRLSPPDGTRVSVEPPELILVVGVNGTGKTTSVAKLAHYFRGRGRKVLLAAADTFRAAAVDQLQTWGERIGIDVIAHGEGTDPAAVVFDAVQAARARGVDLVIADTAGRLHTRLPLMQELQKITRVAEKALGRRADEVWLVLDATIGQNAVSQARVFADTLPLTGLVLTKLDGTARGAVVLAITEEFGLPIRFLGVGEKPQDLVPFSPEEFARDIFAA